MGAVPMNLISVCARCHACLHKGTLTVTFTPGGQLVWRQRADAILLPSGEEGLPPGSVLVADEEGEVVGDLDGSPGHEELETEIAFEVEETREGETEPKAGPETEARLPGETAPTDIVAHEGREVERERAPGGDEPTTTQPSTLEVATREA